MYQNDRASYRTKQTPMGRFRHSCLGRIVILLAIFGVIGFIAWLTRPSEQTMRDNMTDNIRQWIEQRDSTETDGIDDFITNIGYTFTSAASVVDIEKMTQFNKHNHLEYYEHLLFRTVYIFNNFRMEGECCGIGIFGMVIPTVNFNDYILSNDTLRREYNQPIIQNNNNEEYLGENPDLGGVFQYEGE